MIDWRQPWNDKTNFFFLPSLKIVVKPVTDKSYYYYITEINWNIDCPVYQASDLDNERATFSVNSWFINLVSFSGEAWSVLNTLFKTRFLSKKTKTVFLSFETGNLGYDGEVTRAFTPPRIIETRCRLHST